MSEEKTKKRVRKTLTEQIAEKEERIKSPTGRSCQTKKKSLRKRKKSPNPSVNQIWGRAIQCVADQHR